MPDTSPEPRSTRADGLPGDLCDAYRTVRDATLRLAEPLSAEDACVQSMPDASPAKWHLAHTTWFFETFVLAPACPEHRPADPSYALLYNSYYNAVGAQYSRPHRGLITRPSLTDVLDYRARIDECIEALLAGGVAPATAAVVEVGLHHEMQHQELLLMDVKHLFSCNPTHPVYRPRATPVVQGTTPSLAFSRFSGGERWIGAPAEGFSYDNERPRHRVLIGDFELADRLVTNAEFLEFIEDGGYDDPLLWLADGYAEVPAKGHGAPLYWHRGDDGWMEFTLHGLEPLAPDAPVAHVSFYEADAFARWAGLRLPTEQEWESAADGRPVAGNFVEDDLRHPCPAPAADAPPPHQLYGDLWEWTASPYVGYPGFVPEGSGLGEYNGKFMANQMVLRGGAAVTPRAQLRPSYRNFFYPHTGWQFSGIRLAR